MKAVRLISIILLSISGTTLFAQPSAPVVTGTVRTNNTKPTWTWTPGGGGNGSYQYKLDDGDLSSGATPTTNLYYTPATDLSEATHTLYVQESNGTLWSSSGSFAITVDLTAPVVTGVSIPDVPMKVGDVVTATVGVSDDGGDAYTLSSGSIDGFTLGGLIRVNSTTYTATFTVTEGGTDVAAGSDIALSVVLTDGAGNSSTAYTTAISQGNDGIDANSPTITGVSIPNVSMKVGDVVTATVGVSDDGGDAYTLSSGNIDGFTLGGLSRVNSTTYTATFTVTEGGADMAAGSDIALSVVLADGAGNSSTAYTTAISQGSDGIDANTPAKPSAPDLSSGSDSGTSDTDNVTNDNTPTFTGTAEPGSTVTLYSNVDGSVGTALADVLGDWSITASTLTEGDHSVTATATDAAGNVSATSDALILTIDTSNPSSPIISGIIAGSYNTNQTFSVSGEVGAAIEYSIDNKATWNSYIGSVTISSEGTYDITAHQTDVAGNISADAAIITIKIDKTTQMPTLDSPVTDSADDQTVYIDFTLPEAAKSGTVKMTFTRTGGSNDNRAPHIITFNSNFESFGQHTTNLDGSNLSNNVNVSSVGSEPNDALVDGAIYSVKVEYQDELGNTVASVTNTDFSYEAVPPTATVGPVTPDPRNLSVGVVSITFSKIVHIAEVDISDFSLTLDGSPIDISGLTISNTPDGAHSSYSSQFSINLSTKTLSAGNYVFTLNATGSGIYAWGGSLLVADASDTWTTDLTVPTVTSITSTESSPTNASTIPIEVIFSENVTGFTVDDIVVGNGTKSNFSGTGTTYTFDITPSADGLITVDIAGGVCQDMAGNNNTVATQFTITSDKTAPTLLPVSIQSNNTNNTKYAKTGNTVTISFTASETITNVSATINGSAATIVNTGVNTWTASRSMLAGDTEGNVTFNIAFKDNAGNIGTPVASTTNSSTVTFYNTLPTLSSTTIVSDYTNTDKAKVGSIITLSFQSARKLDNVVATIAGHNATTSTADSLSWTATYTMQSLDYEGTIPFTVDFTDRAGNAGSRVTTITSGSNVVFDKTNPELNAVTIASNNTHTNWVGVGGTVTLTITGSENISITSAKIKGHDATLSGSNKNWTASYVMQSSDVDGNVDFSIDFIDQSGNAGTTVTATTNSSSVTFDKVAPTLTSVSIASNNGNTALAKVGDVITISFTSDQSIENVVAKINTKNTVLTDLGANNWTATYTMSTTDVSGLLSFTIDFKDYAGNVGTQVVNATDFTSVTFDKVVPTYTSVKIYSNNANSAYAKDGDVITVDFKTSESIQTPTVTINGIAATSITGGPTDWLATRTIHSGETEGTVQFNIDIQDLAGNTAGTRYSTTDASKVTFDNTSPLISSITLPSGVYKVGNVISILITSDATTYTGTTVEVNGKGQTLVNNGNNSYTVNYTIQEGDNEISASATLPVNIVLSDAAGLTTTKTAATVSSGTVTIDSHTPQILSFSSTAESSGILRVGDEIVFTLTPQVAEVGLTISPSTYNGKNITWATTDGGVTYKATYTVAEGDPEQVVPLNFGNVTLSDAAGNSHTFTTADYNPIQKEIYTVKPTIQITGSKTKCYDGNDETITFQFTGRIPFDLWYNIDGVHYSELAINATSYQIQIPQGTVALDSLLDASTNRIYTAPANATVTVNPLPVVTLDITGSPYTSNSLKDELSQYVLPTDKRTGTFSGEGVGYSSGKYYFYPAAVETTDVDIPVVYAYTDATTGCIGRDTSNVFVSSTSLNILSLNSVYCYDASQDNVDGILPDGHTGTFQVFDSNDNLYGKGWSQTDSVTLVINPKQMDAGNYTVKYTAYKLPLLEQDSYIEKSFTIEGKITGVGISGLSDSYCYNSTGSDVTFTATGFTTEVGDLAHFSGPTTVFLYATDSHTARFKYSLAQANNNYTVSYYYESANGCLSDTASHTVHINPLPQLSFNLQDNYNYDQSAIPLVGNYTSADYLFSGEGISRDTLFTSAARVGVPIVVTYSYTDANGCSNQQLDTTTIYRATETINGLSSTYCYSNATVNISCTPNISDTITGTFVSKRNALESTGKNTALYYIARVGNGKDTVYFNYRIKGTEYSVSKEVFVDSIGIVSISSLDTSYCSSLTKDEIFGTQTYLLGGTGAFTYSGNSEAFSKLGSSAEIYPYKETPGNYSVTYTFTSNQSQCTSSDTKSFVVHQIPSPEFDASIPSNVFILGDSIQLLGNYTTGIFSFSGTGVLNNIFYPDKSEVGAIVLTYYVKDDYGCENQTTKSINVIQANASISGIPSNGWACYYSDTLTLEGTPTNGLTGGEFSGDGIVNGGLGADKAYFYPKLAGGGSHDVTYRYKYTDNVTDLWVTVSVNVDSSDVVEISGFNSSDAYCANASEVSLVSNYSSAVFSGNGIVGKKFYPADAQIGVNRITCQYTNTTSGCAISSYKDITVNAIPSVNFSIENTCTDLETIPVEFTNQTTYAGIIANWQWYLDGLGSVSSEDLDASKIYSTSGAKQIRLTATTEEGCSASKDSIVTIGTGTLADFTWYNDCYSSETPTRFVCTSDSTMVESYTWVVNENSVTQSSRIFDYAFPSVNVYDVKLIVKSKEQCLDSITKQIPIQPVIKITDCTDNAYYQNFEGSDSDWFIKLDDEDEFSSWTFGSPDGTIINSASSGTKAWYTNVGINNQNVENSQVVSPCFDFDTLSRPMMKFDIWSSPEEGRDGAVIQYSKDGGIDWQSLGDIGEGLNWFNSSSIKGKPADDYLGWSKSTNGWISARHNLDSLKGAHLARFRIVYAADAQAIQDFNGFAFDNIWIGNKKQNVLCEYFTNTNLTDATSYYPQVLKVENDKVKDILPIHYHTSSPSGDPLYGYYTSGPSSRVLYYGISQIPYAWVNGTSEFSFPTGLSQSTYFQSFADSIDVKSLYDPKISMSINANMPESDCNINVNLTMNENLTGNRLLLQCAVVKNSIDVDGKTYYNVLRKFVPDAGGTLISSNLGENDTQTINLSWTPSSNDELVNSSIIAFVQDLDTKQVYQVQKFDLSGLTGINPINISNSVDIYPNPATNWLVVDCMYQIDQLYVYDIAGRVVNIYNPNQQQFTVPIETLQSGIYIIKGKTSKGEFVKKFIKQ